MWRKLNVAFCGAAVIFMTAGYASAQSATQEAKEKTKTAAKKTGDATEHAAKKTGEVLTDAEITSAVKTKLLADKQVGGLKIDVDTDHGVVTLTGPVTSTAEKNQALHLARGTKGVKKVVSKLTLEKK
jgi:hyperosmotically inducible periplasmic protein